MNEQAEILVEILNESAKNKQEINIYKKIGLCSLDIICGINFNFLSFEIFYLILFYKNRNSDESKTKCAK